MKTIILDLYQFIFLIFMITFTSWIWMKSIISCPQSFSDEYIILHKKYNQIIDEKNKLIKILNNINQ